MTFVAVPQKEMTRAERRAAEMLYAANLRLVPYCLARFPFLTAQQKEEASTAGMMGLWLAAQNYDPTRGVKFSSYAVDCVRGSLLRHLKVERRQAQLDTVSLDLPIGDGAAEMADLVADPNAEKPGAAAVAQAGFEARIENLGERHQALLRAVYCEDKGFGEVGEAWGLSRARVHQIHLQALKELKGRALRGKAAQGQ